MEGPKFRVFSLSRNHFALFVSLSGCLLVEFWWCLKRRGLKCARLELSGCRVKPRRSQRPLGFHTTAREPKRAHFMVPALQTPPKFHEKTHPERHKKNEMEAERGKQKSEMLGGPAEGGPAQGGRSPNQQQPKQPQPQQHQHRQKWRVGGPRISGLEGRGSDGWAPKGRALSPGLGFGSVRFGLFGFRKFGQNTETLKLAKVGLAKVGLAKVGHDRGWGAGGLPETQSFLRQLAKARDAPYASHSVDQREVGVDVAVEHDRGTLGHDGPTPSSDEVIGDARYAGFA